MAAVGPLDRLRILKQTRLALELQQKQRPLQQLQKQQLQQHGAARKLHTLWLGAGCGSLSRLLACGVSLSVTQALRYATTSSAAFAAAASADLGADAAEATVR